MAVFTSAGRRDRRGGDFFELVGKVSSLLRGRQVGWAPCPGQEKIAVFEVGALGAGIGEGMEWRGSSTS